MYDSLVLTNPGFHIFVSVYQISDSWQVSALFHELYENIVHFHAEGLSNITCA